MLKRPLELPPETEPVLLLEKIIDGFSSKALPDQLSISVSEIYKADKLRRERDIEQAVFAPLLDRYDFLKDSSDLQERYLNTVIDLIKLFNVVLKDKTLLSVFLLDMDLEKFCMFFERSNSKGVALDFIDIVTAKIYSGFNLAQKKEEFREKYKDNSLDDNQFVEVFVRYLSFLDNEKVDKKNILENLEAKNFSDNWDLLCKLFVRAKSVLTEQHLLFRLDWLPYKMMFVPIMHFINKLPNKDFSQATFKQQSFFRFWFWSSLLNTRYGGGMSGSTNSVIVEDCQLLEKIANDEKVSRETLRKFRLDFSPDELYELTGNKSAVFTGIMSLMNHQNRFRELANGGNIDFGQEINVHHIFPKKYVEDQLSEDEFAMDYVDSLLNKMIIGKISNIKFGKKAPSEYLNNPPMNQNPQLEESLDSHLISDGEGLIQGKYDKDFKSFVESRYLLIQDLIDTEIKDVREKLIEWFCESQGTAALTGGTE